MSHWRVRRTRFQRRGARATGFFWEVATAFVNFISAIEGVLGVVFGVDMLWS